MELILDLIREYGFGIVFLNVFVEQLGAPIPAYPVLVVAGAIEGTSWQRLALLTAVAVVVGVGMVLAGMLVCVRIRCAVRMSPEREFFEGKKTKNASEEQRENLVRA